MMTVESLIPHEHILQALPFVCQQRLLIMGWSEPLRNPERLLRRAVGNPQPVRLMDLELDPERWHGQFVSTQGLVSWPVRRGGAAGIGRIWLNTGLLGAAQPALLQRPTSEVTVSGILLADPQVRAAYRDSHHETGGYGERGIFIAALVSVTLQPDPRSR